VLSTLHPQGKVPLLDLLDGLPTSGDSEMIGWHKKSAQRCGRSGASLQSLAEAPLASVLRWAAVNRTIRSPPEKRKAQKPLEFSRILGLCEEGESNPHGC
jgi:hypothetical protein